MLSSAALKVATGVWGIGVSMGCASNSDVSNQKGGSPFTPTRFSGNDVLQGKQMFASDLL